MGQANKRGTFEQRKAMAISAKREYNIEFYTSTHKPKVPLITNRGISPLQSMMIMAESLSHMPLGMRREPVFKNDKGEKFGSCNRTACQKPGANWFNHSTRKYYCEDCAIDLNFHNADLSIDMFGHYLCTEE